MTLKHYLEEIIGDIKEDSKRNLYIIYKRIDGEQVITNGADNISSSTFSLTYDSNKFIPTKEVQKDIIKSIKDVDEGELSIVTLNIVFETTESKEEIKATKTYSVKIEFSMDLNEEIKNAPRFTMGSKTGDLKDFKKIEDLLNLHSLLLGLL